MDAVEKPRKQRAEAVETPLTTGKLNAVRAAFKAGVNLPADVFEIEVSEAVEICRGDPMKALR